MDRATLLGMILGFALIIMSIFISGGDLEIYLSMAGGGASFIMVIFGSYAAMLVTSPLERSLGVINYFRIAFTNPDSERVSLYTRLMQYHTKARRDGILSIEEEMNNEENAFLKQALQLAIDGTDSELANDLLETELEMMDQRHGKGIDYMDNWSKIAPAFGMIGTLAGLIAMMKNLKDPSTIGGGMSLALITTMFGSIFANLIFMPVKIKMEDRHKEEVVTMEMIIVGVHGIMNGSPAQVLKQHMAAFLSPPEKQSLEEEPIA